MELMRLDQWQEYCDIDFAHHFCKRHFKTSANKTDTTDIPRRQPIKQTQ